jgi:UDPglucose 6-dehydrogenase
MHIVMVGTGYVGLVSGTCFAEIGWTVTCIDKDASKIAALKKGEIPIYEPGLAEIVHRNVDNGRLFFSTDLRAATANADMVFLAVGTPMGASGNADLTIMLKAVEDIAASLTKNTTIVIKSTVPVGSCRMIAEQIAKARPELTCAIVSNPEFLREGAAVTDFMQPDRIIIGTECPVAAESMRRLYGKFAENKNTPLLFTSIETAELIKYAANGFLATKIAFINEMADICEAVGANISDVAMGMGMDTRIGHKFLHAGPGFGGSCFPKDTNALAKIARNCGTESKITEAVIASNDTRKKQMAHKIKEACGGNLAGKHITILGVTFKAGTDDMRDSPSLVIIPELLKQGATIAAYDPAGMDNARSLLPDNVEWSATISEAVKGADGVVILTEWQEFAAFDLDRLKPLLRTPVIVDLRNIIDRKSAEGLGFTYVSVGYRNAGMPKIGCRYKVA